MVSAGGSNCVGSLASALPLDLCGATTPGFTDEVNLDLTLAAGSPAVDAGDASFVNPTDTDALGNPRVTGSAVDVGAFER